VQHASQITKMIVALYQKRLDVPTSYCG